LYIIILFHIYHLHSPSGSVALRAVVEQVEEVVVAAEVWTLWSVDRRFPTEETVQRSQDGAAGHDESAA
jgi:hypothetical protein